MAISTSKALNYIGVYKSGLQGKWVKSTWGDIDLIDLSASAPGRSETAVEVRFGPQNAYNAFGFGTSDWSSPYFLNEIRTIELDIYIEADSTGTENLIFILDDAGYAEELSITDFIPGWSGMSDVERFGHWFHVSIDLAQLHPKIAHFGRFLLFNRAGADVSKPHFRLASVRLGWTHEKRRPVVNFGSAKTNLTYDQLTLAFSTNEATTYRVEYVTHKLRPQSRKSQFLGEKSSGRAAGPRSRQHGPLSHRRPRPLHGCRRRAEPGRLGGFLYSAARPHDATRNRHLFR